MNGTPEALGVFDRHDQTLFRKSSTEGELVVVDDLAKVRATGYHDRESPHTAGIHDGAGPPVSNDHVSFAHQSQQFGAREEVVVRQQWRCPRGTVLHEHLSALDDVGDKILDPGDQAIEAVMVCSNRDDDTGGGRCHSTHPTWTPSG